jgi:L-ascorbate metabolism protein UlaG (beta-lactamase superfamily)
MQVQWYGQSAFRLADGERTLVIDPFDDLSPLKGHGRRWDYPAIAGVEADELADAAGAVVVVPAAP